MGMSKVIRAMAIMLIFGLTLWPAGLQLTRMITGQSGVSMGENRALKDWPKWAEVDNDMAKYTANISSFLNDHFGGRAQAIRIRNKLFRIIGDNSVSVVEGRTRGWYFLNDGVLWESFTGRLSYSDDDIEDWLLSLDRLQNAAQNNGAVFAAIIPPDKPRMYPRHVPEKYEAPSDRRFVSALLAHPKSGESGLIDIESALRRAKQEGAIYSKTDTHWTGRGAYAAYGAVMEAFNVSGNVSGASFPILMPEQLVHKDQVEFSGDLAQLMGLKGQVSEILDDVATPNPVLEFTVKVLNDTGVKQPSWQARSYTNEREEGRTLVIIGDSFSNVLIPFFKHSFDKVIFMHHRMGKFDLEAVAEYDPDAILFAPVERTAVTMREFPIP